MVVVPTTLTEPCRVASVSDWAVPVSAARWTTTSGRTSSSRRVPDLRVDDVPDDELDARVERGRPLRGRVHLRVQAVQRDHAVVAVGQATGEGAADEAGASGDQAGRGHYFFGGVPSRLRSEMT